ncbi:Lipase (class 3) [Seinonella peptonophila]|uniref:Lipase (Class 3) n=1 Tax=Seinonella peptonophila TaxID=112248 RepID=A0A1M4Y6R6_9BACL|nr:lipase family protein [Seinonella peptonophila]SHF01152.1 Lipase (class 3) [Seinonella peptonophila]
MDLTQIVRLALSYLANIQQVRWMDQGLTFQFLDSYQLKMKFFLYKRVFAVCLESEEERLIIFRGSQAWYEWLKDFQIRQVPFHLMEGVAVHQGFYDFYLQLRESIFHMLTHKKTDKPITVVGYSLGGAIATMLSVELAIKLPHIEPPRLITFAAPRIGNKKYTTCLYELIPQRIHYVHPGDQVPKQPALPMYQPLAATYRLPRVSNAAFTIPSCFRNLLFKPCSV